MRFASVAVGRVGMVLNVTLDCTPAIQTYGDDLVVEPLSASRPERGERPARSGRIDCRYMVRRRFVQRIGQRANGIIPQAHHYDAAKRCAIGGLRAPGPALADDH